MNHIGKYLVGIALSLAASMANSASVGLLPGSSFVFPGGSVSFDLVVDFGTETTIGGATDITFDPEVLSFASFVFDPTFDRDPGFDVKDLQSPGLVSIGFGDFGGITGAFTAGELQFNVASDVRKGQIATIALADSEKWSGFLDTSGLPIEVSYSPATVTAVPAPATVLLFASGLAMLGMVRLRRRASLA